MLDVPVDAWYLWAGVSVASFVVLGVATGLPSGPPPDAAAAAATIDSVAASPYAATGRYPVDATAVRVTPHRIGLRDSAGAAHARIEYGPVTPAYEGPLRRVLEGAPPGVVFDSPAAFRRAAARARASDPTWVRTERLLVRHVVWEGVDVALLG